MKDNPVTIIKNGKWINIAEDDLCKDDTVVFQAGDIVPADLRLIEATGLEVDEFDLTGEIMPVIKNIQESAMLFRGSKIIKGSGKGIAVATGSETEYGKILEQTWEQENTYRFQFFNKNSLFPVALLLPPFVVQMALSHHPILLILLYLFLSAALMLMQNDDFFRYLLISDEVKKYERYQIQIRDISAIEALNQIDVICFDKTGVLTTREMEVKNLYYADGMPHAANTANNNTLSYLVKTACALCNDVQFYEKLEQANAIDKTLISFAGKNGIDIKELLQNERIYHKPFESENKYMACGYKLKDLGVYYFAKGDPDVVLGMCNRYLSAAGGKKVDSDFRHFTYNTISSINQRGNTAIALAYVSGVFNEPPKQYTFLSILELENPLQHGACETISKITEKRIRSIMLTGDKAETAINISKECGITKGSGYLIGRVIDRMALDEVARQSDHCSVFARLLPSQKGIIIRLFQQRGHHVAMIGDGPNDGIALKVADIGISFHKNSSPIARRLAKILINELPDLLRLMEGAKRIKRSAKYSKLSRALILTAVLLVLYFRAASIIGFKI